MNSQHYPKNNSWCSNNSLSFIGTLSQQFPRQDQIIQVAADPNNVSSQQYQNKRLSEQSENILRKDQNGNEGHVGFQRRVSQLSTSELMKNIQISGQVFQRNESFKQQQQHGSFQGDFSKKNINSTKYCNLNKEIHAETKNPGIQLKSQNNHTQKGNQQKQQTQETNQAPSSHMELQKQLFELKSKKTLHHQGEDNNQQEDLCQLENGEQRIEQLRDFNPQYCQHFQQREFPNDNRQDIYEKRVKHSNMEEIEAVIMEDFISKQDNDPAQLPANLIKKATSTMIVSTTEETNFSEPQNIDSKNQLTTTNMNYSKISSQLQQQQFQESSEVHLKLSEYLDLNRKEISQLAREYLQITHSPSIQLSTLTVPVSKLLSLQQNISEKLLERLQEEKQARQQTEEQTKAMLQSQNRIIKNIESKCLVQFDRVYTKPLEEDQEY